MWKIFKLILWIIFLLSFWICVKIYFLLNEKPTVPNLPIDQWWGSNKVMSAVNTSIRPFEVIFKPEMIDDLKERLNKAHYYTEPLENIGFEYGFNNNYLQEIIKYWAEKYNFNERQKYLNKYPHYITNIQGLDIHFIHIKQNYLKENVIIIPILLLHGWPGSFVEFYRIIPYLSMPKGMYNFVFNIIIPSLPGFGFSQAPSKSGLGEGQIAVIMRNLMLHIGYNKFVVQGGDWGSGIANNMAILFPDNIIGLHTNYPITMNFISTIKVFLSCYFPKYVINKEYHPKSCFVREKLEWLLEESGYFHIQSTKPDTIGVALMDSPSGLAAYILEKFSVWTNKKWKHLKNGGLTKKYSLSELLDNVMIYWISNSITTSMRLYAEGMSKNQMELGFDLIPISVPSAIARFEHEVLYLTDGELRDRYLNLVQLLDYEDGGHFAAFEKPIEFSNDIWSAVEKFQTFNINENIKTEL